MAGQWWVGLDVGVETTNVCVIDGKGHVVREAKCRTDLSAVEMEISFLRRRRHARIGIEAGMGTVLARGLRSLGYTVDVYETRKLSKFLQTRRNKTDAGDAYGIAEAGRLESPMLSKVFLKSLDCQMLAARLSIRRHLIATRVRAKNLLGRQLEMFGGRLGACTTPAILRERVEQEIAKLFGNVKSPLVADLRRVLGRCEALMKEQIRLDKELAGIASRNEVCKRFMEIPGVGSICALTFYAAIGDPRRFKKSADVGPYLGLTPKVFQTGLSMRMGRISKMGHGAVRSLLFYSALRFLSCSGARTDVHVWAGQVEARRGKKRSKVALARKLATMMIAIWKSGERYRPKLAPTLD